MAARFVNIDRDTPMLLPCDLRDWVPTDHVVHFILDAVAQVPIEPFHVNWKGTGDAQYPPRLLLALLIYCYATGRSSSRAIEAATYSDVIVRYLCAHTHPDPGDRTRRRPGPHATETSGARSRLLGIGTKPSCFPPVAFCG